MIIADVIFRRFPNIDVFTIDTGRLHEQTYEFIQHVRDYYQETIKCYFPQQQKLEQIVNLFGPNVFYQSVSLRKDCCEIRKLEPLNRALLNKRAWISGLRRQQSTTRASTHALHWDSIHQIPKFNPLFNWTTEEVWGHIHKNAIPYSSLYDSGYTSIGCAPCTKLVLNVEPNDLRAGRWWWENPDNKECGIHSETAIAS